MDLIKKLGGYEKAKWWEHHLIQAEKKGIHHNGVNSALLFTLIELQELLLDHRCEHNIFEVGDKVVFIHPFELGDLFTVHSICERFIGVKHNNDECIYYAEIVWGLKHATTEEIAAGHRL